MLFLLLVHLLVDFDFVILSPVSGETDLLLSRLVLAIAYELAPVVVFLQRLRVAHYKQAVFSTSNGDVHSSVVRDKAE